VKSEVIQLLFPGKDISLIEHTAVYLEAVYVQRHREENPKRKSQVNNLTEYRKNDPELNMIWYDLRDYPWLRNYVKFGRTALVQLLLIYEGQLEYAIRCKLGNSVKKINDLRAWIEAQSGNDGK